MAPATVRRAPYRDCLQPAFQSRFTAAVLVSAVVAYVEAISRTKAHLLWSWLPLGPAGARAVAILTCAILVLILRVAHIHVGLRTSNSGIETFIRHTFSLASFWTVVTYTFSAFVFSQIFLLTESSHANLRWINYLSGYRARLNERALFYTLTVTLMGTVEAIVHLCCDYDQLPVGRAQQKIQSTGSKLDDFWKFLADARRYLARSLTCGLLVAMFNYGLAYTLARSYIWRWPLAVFRLAYNLPKTNLPPSSRPWDLLMLLRALWACTLLHVLWGMGNVVFTLRLAKSPIKNGLPLTSESKDPNGSLLNGLKSKKPRFAAFAMWELAVITVNFEARRKSLFADIDRPGGAVWSQIYAVCSDKILMLGKRAAEYGETPVPSVPAPDHSVHVPSQPRGRVVEPPSTADIWHEGADSQGSQGFGSSVRRHLGGKGKPSGKNTTKTLMPLAWKTAVELKDKLLTKQRQDQLGLEGLTAMFQNLTLPIIRLEVFGWPFRQTYSRRFAKAVLGTPYGDVSIYINAAFVLGQLAVCSLQEDTYGKVQQDLAPLVRLLTQVIQHLEAFPEKLGLHWTDVEGHVECVPMDDILDALKDALTNVLTPFEKYAAHLELTADELLAAKAAAEKKAKEPQAAREAVPEKTPSEVASEASDHAQPPMANVAASAEQPSVAPYGSRRRPERNRVR